MPVPSAERFLIFAFAAHHPEWGNNTNSDLSVAISTCRRLISLQQMSFQLGRQCTSAFPAWPRFRERAAAFPSRSDPPRSMKSYSPVVTFWLPELLLKQASTGLSTATIGRNILEVSGCFSHSTISSSCRSIMQDSCQTKMPEKWILLINQVCILYIVREEFAHLYQSITQNLHVPCAWLAKRK